MKEHMPAGDTQTQTGLRAGLQGGPEEGTPSQWEKAGLEGPQRATRGPGSREETPEQAGVEGTRGGHRGARVETFTGEG